jgi:hypothetical protein
MNWYKSAGKWTKGDGDCFRAALNLLLVRNFPKNKGDSLIHAFVHGRGKAYGHRFPHAWVETKEGIVMDHSGGKHIDIPKEFYYSLGNIDPNEKGAYVSYTLADTRKKVTKHKHYGPWDLNIEFQKTPENWIEPEEDLDEENDDDEDWDDDDDKEEDEDEKEDG